ncbi:MAG: M24 family metallopeptidase [Candidatus Heimdallarchaeota archaeon]
MENRQDMWQQEQLTRSQEVLEQSGYVAWLICTTAARDPHILFLTGRQSPGRTALLITPSDATLLVSDMDAGLFMELSRVFTIESYSTSREFTKKLAILLKTQTRNGPVALDHAPQSFETTATSLDFVTYGEFLSLVHLVPEIEFKSAVPFIEKLRKTKTSYERNLAYKAIKITQEVMEDLPNRVKPGMTERQVAALIGGELLNHGELAFPTIVASGQNSANPHHNTNDKKLHPNEVLLVDAGLRLELMCSDLTYTFFVGRNPPEQILSVYDSVFTVLKYILQIIRPRIQCSDVDLEARKKLKELGQDPKYFIHSLGHPIGLVVHDIGPRLSFRNLKTSENLLPLNSLYTLEPGLYFPGKWGLRLEVDIHIADGGVRALSTVPSQLVTI